jgi:predicted MPP superfamily phosphohydrolase
LGFFFYLVLTTVASDAGIALLRVLLSDDALMDGVQVARIQAASVLSTSLVLAGLALRNGLRPPELRRVEVILPRLPDALSGFRIVQISDIHIGPLLDRRFAEHLRDRINALDPDIVAVTGDLVDGSVSRIGHEVEPLRDLRSRHGVFSVTGNHDHYSGADDWVARTDELGWRTLRNQHVTIEHAGEAFHLAGVDDRNGAMMGDGGGEDLPSALEARNPEYALVLLAHDPATFRRASKLGIDLQISGHTHGGQIWPFNWAVRAAVPWVRGHHRVEESQLYVSSGTGFWGPPMRLGTTAEITELILRSR